MVTVRDVPEGQAMSGWEVYDFAPDDFTYERQMGKNTTAVPLTVYCPQCSDTTAYDRRVNAVVPKWTINHSDYVFNVGYQEEDGKKFAVCLNCGHDLRDEVKGKAAPKKSTRKITRKSQERTLAATPEMIEDVKFEDGYFTMTVDEFKRIAKKGHEVSHSITPAAEFGGTLYVISLSKFITFWKELEINGNRKVGIPRIYFQEA